MILKLNFAQDNNFDVHVMEVLEQEIGHLIGNQIQVSVIVFHN